MLKLPVGIDHSTRWTLLIPGLYSQSLLVFFLFFVHSFDCYKHVQDKVKIVGHLNLRFFSRLIQQPTHVYPVASNTENALRDFVYVIIIIISMDMSAHVCNIKHFFVTIY